MRKFTCTGLTGICTLAGAARDYDMTAREIDALADLQIGEAFTDDDGDVWERVDRMQKTFRFTNPEGTQCTDADEGCALSAVSTATDSLLVQWCPVGGSFVDSDGYTWERIE